MLKKILNKLLSFFSKKILNKYHPDIVGITGSVGKTSAKEAVARILASKFNVRATSKNYNNEIGVPLTIIGSIKSPGRSVLGWAGVFGKAVRLLFLRDAEYPKILVLEMGADKPGDIQYLTELAPCKVGVLTFISHAHTEFFKTIKKIAQEKRVIISHLKKDGFAVLNYDSEAVMENAEATMAEKITYGTKEGADLQATDVNIITGREEGRPMGLNFKVNYKGNSVPVFLTGIISSRFIHAALAGLSVGVVYGINLVEGAEALRALEPIAGHLNPLSGIKNSLIIDDTYNSSPEAVKAALETLSQIKVGAGKERYAVLGDMLELGPETETAHREVGFRVAELGVDCLITVGEASKGTASAAREAGLDEHRVVSFADSVSAGKFLQEIMKEGDVILVKGSQGLRMEKIVKEVMAEPLKAKELLVRQGEEWEKR